MPRAKKQTPQCPFLSRRTRAPESCHGGSQDRPDVWHADLCVEERQGRGKEAVMGKVSEPQSPITQ